MDLRVRSGASRLVRTVFRPGTALLGRLRYATKFAFIALVLLLPLAFVARAYVQIQTEQVAFSAKERLGVAYVAPLLALTRDEVDATHRAALGRRPVNTDRAVARVDAADRRHGAVLGVRPQWLAARRLVLAAAAERDGRARVAAHESARAALLGLIVRVGDASNLTLDPDLDTYYLMDALQFRLPAMLDVSGRLVDGLLASSGSFARDTRSSAALDTGAQAGALEGEMAALKRGLSTTVTNTASVTVQERLPDRVRRLEAAIATLRTRSVDRATRREPRAVPSDAAAPVQEQISLLADLIAPQLDELLDVRVSRLEANARRVKLILLFSGLLAAYLFVGFYRSVGPPVRDMVATLRAVGDGDLSRKVVVESRDELLQIAEAINQTVAQTRAVTERLAQEATHDALTGLPNRTLVYARLEQGLARVRRQGTGMALLFIDLDGFKLVNDARGHEAGDTVLRIAAERLCGLVREMDTVGRFAGDEFVIVCEDVADVDAGVQLARRVIATLQVPFPLAGEVHAAVGASVGVAFADADRPAEPDTLMRDADTAMYRAKQRGKGRVEIFDETLRASVANREVMRTELLRAIEGNELVLHYQPIVNAETREATGVEALIRWDHPRRGLLAPTEFIPLAEDTGSIVPLGAWVLRTACRQLSEWLAEEPALRGLTMSVNLSVDELSDPRLVERVRDNPARHGPRTRRVVARAHREHGDDRSCRGPPDPHGDQRAGREPRRGRLRERLLLALLSARPSRPADQDRPIVRRQRRRHSRGRGDRRARRESRKALDLDVVAEGVETDQQLDDVLRLGCGSVQGFLFGRPLPPTRRGHSSRAGEGRSHPGTDSPRSPAFRRSRAAGEASRVHPSEDRAARLRRRPACAGRPPRGRASPRSSSPPGRAPRGRRSSGRHPGPSGSSRTAR
jgi:diguanylate cyclase (GGDEF)-like protein